MSQHLSTKLRLFVLWEELQRQPDEPIAFGTLIKAIDEHIKGGTTTQWALKDLLLKLRDEHRRPGTHIVIEKGGDDKTDGTQRNAKTNYATAMLKITDDTAVDKQEAAYPELKRNLGAVLWKYLFDIELPPGVEATPPEKSVTDELDRKVAALRRKATVSLAVDAGSTTKYAIEQLLSVESLPLRVRNPMTGVKNKAGEAAGSEAGSFHLIVPTITTNSFSIVNVVLNSIHRRNIQTRLVGGDVRLDRKSICGSLTESCIQQWNTRMDLALIGTTSYLPGDSTTVIPADSHPGFPAFACDDVSEAWLKAAFLERCWFRVLVLHSAKLLKHDGTSVFAALSRAVVDLVVIDDGKEVDATKRKDDKSAAPASAALAVKEFSHAAAEARVPVLLLGTSAQRD